MADEYGFYGKKNRNSGSDRDPESDYADNLSNAQNDFDLPDYTGALDTTGRNTPRTGRPDTFTVRFGNGMKAVADTKEALSNPDNAPSTRIFQAGNHDAISSAIQDEHNPDNAASTRAFQGMNHDVAKNTFGAEYDLDKQPSSSFWKGVQGNGKRVSGLEAVEITDRDANNLDYDNQGKSAYFHSKAFYNGFGNAFVKGLEPTHRWNEYLNASRRPDLYTEQSPQQTSEKEGNKLVAWNKQINNEYRDRQHHEKEPTAEAIRQATQKYSNLLGGVAGTSLLMAVQRNLVPSWGTMSMNNWSRLSTEIYRKVKDRTGNEELALALGWGAVATLAEDIAPFGLASRVLPTAYQTIAEPVHRVLDSLVSDYFSNGVVDGSVDIISNDSKERKNKR